MTVKLGCLADVFLTPFGPSEASAEESISKCEPLLRESGLTYLIHEGGITIDGEWTRVTDLIGVLHETIHATGFMRVHSDIRMGTRIDKEQTFEDKIDVVEEKLKKFE